jgi:hypothetical protein
MLTRTLPRALDREDALHLGDREPEASSLYNEAHHGKRVAGVQPVAGLCPPWGFQDPGSLVDPERLGGDSTPPGHFADSHAAHVHGDSVNPAPWGKVKPRL